MITYIKKNSLNKDELEELIHNRRMIHSNPEIGYHEYNTSKFIAGKLREYGYIVKEGIGKTGITGLLKEKSEGKTLLLRADMDALSLQEENHDLDYRSQNDGLMHACGHDAHVAILLIVAKKLMERKEHINGNVKLIFQPAEEGLNGAEAMIKDGVLDNPKVDNAFGLHVFTDFEIGKIGVAYGGVMAGVVRFNLNIIGEGGHGANPSQTIDPVIVASEVVTVMQSVVSRSINQLTPSVITFGTIHGGTAFNIIPEKVSLTGTVRIFDMNTHEQVKKRFEEVVNGVCMAHGAEYELQYQMENQPVVNDKSMTDIAFASAVDVIGAENIIEYRSMGGEDMSSYLNRVPGCMFFVGASNPQKGIDKPHHNPHFNIDEDCMPIGVEMFLDITEKYFNQN